MNFRKLFVPLPELEKRHCEYCGHDYIVKRYGKLKAFFKWEGGKIVEDDDQGNTCYWNHRELLDIAKKMK